MTIGRSVSKQRWKMEDGNVQLDSTTHDSAACNAFPHILGRGCSLPFLTPRRENYTWIVQVYLGWGWVITAAMCDHSWMR